MPVFAVWVVNAFWWIDGTEDTQSLSSSACFRCLCSHVSLNKQETGITYDFVFPALQPCPKLVPVTQNIYPLWANTTISEQQRMPVTIHCHWCSYVLSSSGTEEKILMLFSSLFLFVETTLLSLHLLFQSVVCIILPFFLHCLCTDVYWFCFCFSSITTISGHHLLQAGTNLQFWKASCLWAGIP